MKYLFFPNSCHVEHISCGQLVKKENFLHQRRNIDSYVLIYVTKGVLFISQAGRDFEVKKNQFLVLRAFTEHYGVQPSKEELHYFWVHFYLPECSEINEAPPLADGLCVLPEYGFLPDTKRIPLLFNQLLDMAKSKYTSSPWLLHHMLSALCIELSGEFFYSAERELREGDNHIYRIQEWIRHSYQNDLRVHDIAVMFHYNPDYLSSDFKKKTGKSMIRYINEVRIEAAKNMLVTDDMPMTELALYCGFTDEKYFFRVFRQLTGMTPLNYKKTFCKKKQVER